MASVSGYTTMAVTGNMHKDIRVTEVNYEVKSDL